MSPSDPGENESPTFRSDADVPTDSDLTELARIARTVREQPHRVRRHLTRLVEDTNRLATVAGRSSKHPNGFTKIVVAPDRIRLHVWEEGRESTDNASDAHTHRWDFASLILAGAIYETSFEPHPRGETFIGFDHDRVDDTARLTNRPGARLTRGTPIPRPTGSIYIRSRKDLHSAGPPDGRFTVSLVLQGAHSADAALVYRSKAARRPDQETPIGADHLRAVLERVLAELPDR